MKTIVGGPGSASIPHPSNGQSPLMPNSTAPANIVESPALHARRSTPGSAAIAQNGTAIVSPYKR